jgi:glycosyltransferase involved in cell wall biosynthesis
VRIIQVPFCFYPDAAGGTEAYVTDLARALANEHGREVVIAAPGAKSEEYVHDGLRVRRFATSAEVNDVSELYGEGDELAAAEFDKILEEEKPDIVHLHAFTRGVSLKLVRAAKARTIPVAFTYHTPTVSCLRGTMMHWGAEPCDGVMDARVCAACTLHGKGMPRLAAQVLAHFRFPNPAPRFRFGTALRMRSLVEFRHATTRSLFDEVDHIIAVCWWVKDVLIRNGVPEHKITLCRQGVVEKSEVESWKPRGERTQSASPVRIAFLGRLDPTKGVHVLIRAVRFLPSARIALDIFGIIQGRGRYEQRLRAIANGDNRIQFRAPVPADQVVPTLRNYDLLAVPSQWLETGPLVVLEAFAAGIPVIGPRLGGIAELVTDGVNGILVEPNSVPAWAAALEKTWREPESLKNLRAQIQPPRTMSRVAEEMANLYSTLGNRAPHRALA